MPWKQISVATLIVACALAQWTARASGLQHRTATQVYEHVMYLPPPHALRIFSLGHREALADLLWTRGLVYLGEESIRNLGAEYVLRYGRAVVALDPYFGRAYRVFAIGFNSRVGDTTEQSATRIRESLAFLEEGIRLLPDDGELAWDTGAIYTYTLAPRLKSETAYREAKMKGLEHMRAAVLRGAGPTWAGMANASTLIRLGQTEQAIKHLQELYSITSNPEVRIQIEHQLTRLRSEAFTEGLRQVAIGLERDHRRDFPYVSEAMYLLLGRRPLLGRNALLAGHFDPVAMTVTDEQPPPQ